MPSSPSSRTSCSARPRCSGARRRRRSMVRSPTSPRWAYPLEPARTLSRLSPAQRHALTIAKAFAFGAKIVALDEPTTSMLEHNVEAVLDRVRQLAAERDIGVIFVSHKMPEVMAVSDRVVVLRDGRVGFESPIAETTTEEIVRNMVGRELLASAARTRCRRTLRCCSARPGWTRPDSPVSNDISVRAGEVVGIAGLVGSGRTEFLRAIVRADPGCGGTLVIDGEACHHPQPEREPRRGYRVHPGGPEAPGAGAADAGLRQHRPHRGTRSRRHRAVHQPTSPDQGGGRARHLPLAPAGRRPAAPRQYSGGNQQKLVIAKWLRRGSRVFLFDEPTKGVDVGGKAEIYGLIDQLCRGRQRRVHRHRPICPRSSR